MRGAKPSRASVKPAPRFEKLKVNGVSEPSAQAADSIAQTDPSGRRAFAVTVLVILALAAAHLYYVVESRIPPSTDEAHYMSGSLSIADGIRSGTVRGMWNGYQNALLFKAPLVCFPGALLMLMMGGLTLPNYVSLVLTFVALGFASYSLFRRCLRPFQASISTMLLLTTPMITGLAHRFYVELLLVLLAVVYIDILLSHSWGSAWKSAWVGILLGLGLLCKSSFPALIALPTLYSLGIAARRLRSAWAWTLIPNLLLAGFLAAIVAGSWYLRNWRETLKHAETSASALSCYYPRWIQADISAGPGVVVFCFAVVGLAVIVGRLLRGSQGSAQRQAWIMLLLLGLTTVFLGAITVNKATRFEVTALPMIACLAVAAWPDSSSSNWPRYGMIALAAVSFILALDNSFGILPIGEVGVGDLRLVDDRFPLNVPGWYEDNHPIDRRDYRLEKAEVIVANDARAHFSPDHTAEARTTILSLLLNHDYFQVLAAADKSPVRWTWWPGSVTSGPNAPDYILGFEGFENIYPGVHFFNHYPSLEEDVASRRVPYHLLARVDGAAQTSVLVYAKNR